MSAINYEKGIHRHWMSVVNEQRSHDAESVIRRVKERFERGTVTEVQLIEWGRECSDCPHAFIETLLYSGIDFD